MSERIDAVEKDQDLPNLEKGMRLEVVTLENKLIFIGIIDWMKQDTLQIVDVAGADVPSIPYNSMVKLRGFYHSKAISLEGQVKGNTRLFWHVANLKMLQISEQRGYFRQNISCEAKVMCVNEQFGVKKPGNAWKATPVACKVANISATGILIQSQENFEEGDWLRLTGLELIPGEELFTMTCVVRRLMLQERTKGYGCEFYGMEGKEQERLIKSILVLQRKERQARQDSRD